jgi:hypothetical protein
MGGMHRVDGVLPVFYFMERYSFMPRKITNKVDFFSHDCKHGKTIFILEQRFGNDGFAFWYKLLELLGDTENHYYDAQNPASWQYLLAYTKVSEITVTEIINTLISLGKLDVELWEKRKIIWCENFVKGLEDVYKKRSRPLPIKPNINSIDSTDIGISGNINRITGTEIDIDNNSEKIISGNINRITGTEIPHSKVKESKVKESKVNSSDKKSANPEIKEIVDLMYSQMKLINPQDIDPIPTYGKEVSALKRMLKRGFSKNDIFQCWKMKVDYRKEFVSMAWINQDIADWLNNGKKFINRKNGKVRIGENDERDAINEFRWKD